MQMGLHTYSRKKRKKDNIALLLIKQENSGNKITTKVSCILPNREKGGPM